MAVWGLHANLADFAHCALSKAWGWEAQEFTFDFDPSHPQLFFSSREEGTMPSARQEEVGVKRANELPSRGQATELTSGRAKEGTQVCLVPGLGSLPGGQRYFQLCSHTGQG